ncbi:PASTA domain-containing protein [Baekduia sp. Peel2402]|uniref:PASTA domain-containing protein n=1 Tax=Baekduia sp. Peel2402 TaxID=3458296 RepID=UPI00403EBF09
MAGDRGQEHNGWTIVAAVLAVLIVVVIVVTAVLWVLSGIGHVLGLTPTYSEATDRPTGWVADHYEHVVWGYVLTVVAMLALIVLTWLGVRLLRSEVGARQTAGRGAGATAALLLLILLVLPVGRRDGIPEAVAVADTGTPTVTSETAKAVQVPDVTGLTAAKARDALEGAELRATLRYAPAGERRCRVFAQDPSAGETAAGGDAVSLRCRARIPAVARHAPRAAERRIEEAGFDARIVGAPGDGGLDRCRVRSQSRSGLAEPETVVRLRLTCRPKPKPKPKPKPAPKAPVAPAPAEPSCDPSYSGACLDADASDYDCAGGSGDGPQYTGPVTVVGDDHFDLDRDGDGAGCETS